jgi:hypothetical protein
MQEAKEGGPIKEIECGLNGLKPASWGFVEMLFSDAVLDVAWHTIHVEIVFAQGSPEARIVPVEARKGQLG